MDAESTFSLHRILRSHQQISSCRNVLYMHVRIFALILLFFTDFRRHLFANDIAFRLYLLVSKKLNLLARMVSPPASVDTYFTSKSTIFFYRGTRNQHCLLIQSCRVIQSAKKHWTLTTTFQNQMTIEYWISILTLACQGTTFNCPASVYHYIKLYTREISYSNTWTPASTCHCNNTLVFNIFVHYQPILLF